MSVILIDGLKTFSFLNGILRIDCIVAGSDAEERASGTLLTPGNQARQVVQAVVGATQELEKKLREEQQARAAAAAQQPPPGNA